MYDYYEGRPRCPICGTPDYMCMGDCRPDIPVFVEIQGSYGYESPMMFPFADYDSDTGEYYNQIVVDDDEIPF